MAGVSPETGDGDSEGFSSGVEFSSGEASVEVSSPSDIGVDSSILVVGFSSESVGDWS